MHKFYLRWKYSRNQPQNKLWKVGLTFLNSYFNYEKNIFVFCSCYAVYTMPKR